MAHPNTAEALWEQMNEAMKEMPEELADACSFWFRMQLIDWPDRVTLVDAGATSVDAFPDVPESFAEMIWSQFEAWSTPYDVGGTLYQNEWGTHQISMLCLGESLCPMHRVDYAICFDDDEPECSQIRAVLPMHDT